MMGIRVCSSSFMNRLIKKVLRFIATQFQKENMIIDLLKLNLLVREVMIKVDHLKIFLKELAMRYYRNTLFKQRTAN